MGRPEERNDRDKHESQQEKEQPASVPVYVSASGFHISDMIRSLGHSDPGISSELRTFLNAQLDHSTRRN